MSWLFVVVNYLLYICYIVNYLAQYMLYGNRAILRLYYSGISETKQREVGTTSSMFSQSFSHLITVNLQYNSIKLTKHCPDVYCVKGIRIRGWSV